MDIPVAKTNKQRWLARAKKPYVWISVILLSLTAIPFFMTVALPSIEESEVWVGQVKRGQLAREVRGVGVLAPAQMRWVVSESQGRVERLLIKPGARVNPDTVIAHISNPQLNRSLQQAKWDLDAARANLLAVTAEMEEQRLEQELMITEAEMDYEAAKMLEKAQQPLAEQSIISAVDFENTKLSTRQSEVLVSFRKKTQSRRLDVINARLDAEQAAVQKFQNMVEHIEAQVEELTVRAGIDGVLQAINVEIGQQVEVGSNIAHVADPESLIAELQIPQVQAKDLTLDLLVSIDTRNGFIAGRVSRIDPRVTQGNVQVDVEFTDALPRGARPDLSVTGIITIESIDDALYVDRPTGSSPQTDSSLYVFDPENQVATRTSVKLGRASVSQVEVISGLSVGDFVLVSDTSAFNQHPQIRITQ